MTLGILLPLVFLVIALVEMGIFPKWREDGLVSERASIVMTATSFALLPVLYLLFALVFPDIGAIQVF